VNEGNFFLIVCGVLLASSFVKIFTTLTLLRCGLGLVQWELGIPIFALSLCLTFFIMDPDVSLSDYGEWKNNESGFQEKIAPFLRNEVDPEVYQRLLVLQKTKEEKRQRKESAQNSEMEDAKSTVEITPQVGPVIAQELLTSQIPEVTVTVAVVPEPPKQKKSEGVGDFALLLASFMISQLKDAFEIGFVLLVPFLVVDLLIINILMVLGVRSLSTELVAVPLKVLLFFSVDGWTLLSEKLIKEFL
jgi:flagellar biosynthesis protein FliP